MCQRSSGATWIMVIYALEMDCSVSSMQVYPQSGSHSICQSLLLYSTLHSSMSLAEKFNFKQWLPHSFSLLFFFLYFLCLLDKMNRTESCSQWSRLTPSWLHSVSVGVRELWLLENDLNQCLFFYSRLRHSIIFLRLFSFLLLKSNVKHLTFLKTMICLDILVTINCVFLKNISSIAKYSLEWRGVKTTRVIKALTGLRS